MSKLMTRDNREIDPKQTRTFALNTKSADQEARTVELAFSSEEEYERWWGVEILGHGDGEIRLDRITNAAPLLADHNMRDQIGVVETVSIDKDAKGRAVVRFSKSARGEEIFQDVLDGIRTKVSVGYMVHNLKLIEEREGVDVYRVTDWEPYEVSIVSVPADDTVGIGRDASDEGQKINLIMKEKKMPEDVKEGLDLKQIEQETREKELKRIEEINAIGEKHNAKDIAVKMIKDGKSVDDMRAAVLEKMDTPEPVVTEPEGFERGKNNQREFSLLRAIRALANPNDASAQKAAEYEFEVSRTAAKAAGITPNGIFVPHGVFRAMTVGVPANGGNFVGTEMRGDMFIERLKNRSTMLSRATVLSDLTGNVQIPRQISSVAAAMLSEVEAITGSDFGIDQLDMSPKRVGASTTVSKQLLMQSSVDVEALIEKDIVSEIGLKIDLMAITGSGTGSEPTGIFNTSGVGVVVIGDNGGAPTFGHIIDLESEVADANADVGDLGYTINARTRGKLKQTAKAANTAQFIIDGNEMNGYMYETTNQIPGNLTKGTGTGLSAILFGNYADLIVGLWGGIDIIVDPYTLAKEGKIVITADQFFDVAVRRPQSFAVILDAATA